MKPLRLALALALSSAGAAQAQDPLAAAQATYQSFFGTWAEPGKSCGRPADTWTFGPGTVMAGTTPLDLRGIGGGEGAVLVDLVSRATGAPVPLSLRDTGSGIEISGSGVYANLVPCQTALPQPEPEPPVQEETITTQSLDNSNTAPTEEELRQALALPSGQTPDPEAEPEPDTAEAEAELDPVERAESAFGTRFAGSYSGPSGSCDWQLSESRISGTGESYNVVNFSGEGDRIGVQALRSDGAPTTFTVTPSGNGARLAGKVAGSDETIDLTLTPC